MSKFYLVPVTTRNIEIKGKTLYKILEDVDIELYLREKVRVELTYERKECYLLAKSGYINRFNEYTSLLYNERKVPEKLILKEDESGLREFYTDVEVECDNKPYLEAFEVSPKSIRYFLRKNDKNYHARVVKFMKKANKKEKVFFKCKNSVKHNK